MALAAAQHAMLLRRALAPALARSLRTPALARAYRATPRAAAGYFKHFPTAANPANTDEFEFTPESEEKIKFTLSKFPDTLQGKQSGIMPMLSSPRGGEPLVSPVVPLHSPGAGFELYR